MTEKEAKLMLRSVSSELKEHAKRVNTLAKAVDAALNVLNIEDPNPDGLQTPPSNP
jgi:hypothetical protein